MDSEQRVADTLAQKVKNIIICPARTAPKLKQDEKCTVELALKIKVRTERLHARSNQDEVTQIHDALHDTVHSTRSPRNGSIMEKPLLRH
jgi:hypothetical protein